MCVCVCFLPIHSGHQVRWTYQPGSHRRKVTQVSSFIYSIIFNMHTQLENINTGMGGPSNKQQMTLFVRSLDEEV